MGLFNTSFILNKPLLGAVTRHIPKKRELKAIAFLISQFLEVAGHKAYPDEMEKELAAVFSVPATPWRLASPRIFLVEDHILLLISFLDEPLPYLIRDQEKIPLNMWRWMVLGKAEIDSAAYVYWHLIKALVY